MYINHIDAVSDLKKKEKGYAFLLRESVRRGTKGVAVRPPVGKYG